MSNSSKILPSNSSAYKRTAFCITFRMWQMLFTCTLCFRWNTESYIKYP